MSLQSRESKRGQKPALPLLHNLSGQVTFSKGYVPKQKKPEPSSRFEQEFSIALKARGNVICDLNILKMDPIPIEIPKRLDRRIRNAKGRVARAALKVAIATRKAGLAHGDAVETYAPHLEKAELKLTYRELQLAGQQAQARTIAKEHHLNWLPVPHLLFWAGFGHGNIRPVSAGLFFAYFLHFSRNRYNQTIFSLMSTTTVSPTSHPRAKRRTHTEVIYADMLKQMQKMDDAYALAKVRMAEFEFATGKCKSYDNVEELIYELAH